MDVLERQLVPVLVVAAGLFAACASGRGDSDDRRALQGSPTSVPAVVATPDAAETAPSSTATPPTLTVERSKAVSAPGSAEREAEIADLNRKLADATPEERAALLEEYERMHPAPETLASDPSNEFVTWPEARDWWPYPTLLRLESGLRPGYAEEVVASSPSGGRSGNPRTEYGFVVGYYTYGGRTSANSKAADVVRAGGVILQNFVYPRGTVPAPVASGHKGAKTVRTRGRTAVMVVRKPPDSSAYLTTVRWQEPSGDGGVLEWQLQADPRHWSDESLITLLDEATAIER